MKITKEQKQKIRKTVSIFSTVFWSALFISILVLIWPISWGGKFQMILVSGNSMYPTYSNGDLVLALNQEEYEIQDIVVYHPDELPCSRCNIVHRIIDTNDYLGGYITQGDNNDFIDPWYPTDGEIVGKTIVHVPLGPFSNIFYSHYTWLTLFFAGIGVFLGMTLYQEGRKIWGEDNLESPPPEEDEETLEDKNISASDDMLEPEVAAQKHYDRQNRKRKSRKRRKRKQRRK